MTAPPSASYAVAANADCTALPPTANATTTTFGGVDARNRH